MLEKVWRKGNPPTLLVGMCSHYEKHSIKVSSKLKIGVPYDPAILLLGIYLEKILIQKDTCTSVFITALFTIAKTWERFKHPSTDESIKKVCHTYTMEY